MTTYPLDKPSYSKTLLLKQVIPVKEYYKYEYEMNMNMNKMATLDYIHILLPFYLILHFP